MLGLLKVWVQSWQSVQTEALAAAQLAGNAGTSVGSKAFALLNSVASSGTMGVAMLSVTVTTVVSTASVVYDVVLDPQSNIQAQQTSFDSGVTRDEDGNLISIGDQVFEFGAENSGEEQQGSPLLEMMNAVHNPDEEHTEYIAWVPDEQFMLDSGIWTEDEVTSIFEDMGLSAASSGNESISSQNDNTPPTPVTTEPPPQGSSEQGASMQTPAEPMVNIATPPAILMTPPVITITQQPRATLTVNEGSISGSLSVTATRTGIASLTYQWYSNTTGSNTGGRAIPGATGQSFFIPTNLTQGTYYYYVVVSAAGGTSRTSNVSVVTVAPPVAPLQNLTVVSGGENATPSGMRAQGFPVDLNPGLRFGYRFDGWTVTSGSVTLTPLPQQPGFPTHRFTMPANSVTITATWVEIIPTITITAQPVSQNSQVGSGGLLAVSANVNTGFPISYQWYYNTTNSNIGGTPVAGAIGDIAIVGPYTTPGIYYYYVEVSSYGIPTIKSDVAVITVSSVHTVTVVSDGGDYPTQSGSHASGSTVRIFPGFKAGYEFIEWTASPALPSPGFTYENSSTFPGAASFTMPANNVTVTAIWKELPPDKFTVKIIDAGDFSFINTSGDATGDSGPSFTPGIPIFIEAGNKSGQIFTGWTVTSDNVTLQFPINSSLNSFVMPSGDVTVTANWDKEEQFIVTLVSPGCSMMPIMSLMQTSGTIAEFSPWPRSDTTFVGWTVSPDIPFTEDDPILPGGPTQISFRMPANDVILTVNWADMPQVQQSVLIVVSEGTTNPIASSLRTPGDTVIINAGTRAGATFDGWTASPDIPSGITENGNSAMFTMPVNNVKVMANWIPIPYTVNVISTGATGDSGSGTYFMNDTVEIDAGTRADHTFIGWRVTYAGTSDSVPLTIIGMPNLSSEKTTFTMPAFDVDVTANWVEEGTLFTVNVVSEGAFGASGSGSYAPGDIVEIFPGMHLGGATFAGWTSLDIPTGIVQGFPVSTFIMPGNDVTVTANWQFTVTVVSDGALGRNAINMDTWEMDPLLQSVLEGHNIMIIAGMKPGYTFSHWEVIPSNLTLDDQNATPTNFTMPASNVIIIAIWDDDSINSGGSPIQQSGTLLITDSTEPPEPETGELTDPSEPPNGDPTGDGTEPPVGDGTEPPTGDGVEPLNREPPIGDGAEPTEPKTGETPKAPEATKPPEPEAAAPPKPEPTNPPPPPPPPPEPTVDEPEA